MNKVFVLLQGERGEGGIPLGAFDTLIQAQRASGFKSTEWVKNPPGAITKAHDCWLRKSLDNDVDEWWIVRFTR